MSVVGIRAKMETSSAGSALKIMNEDISGPLGLVEYVFKRAVRVHQLQRTATDHFFQLAHALPVLLGSRDPESL